MPKGPLRVAIERMFAENAKESGIGEWWKKVRQRYEEAMNIRHAYRARAHTAAVRDDPEDAVSIGMYALTGNENWIAPLREKSETAYDKSLSEEIADEIHNLFANPASKEVIESLGSVITEPILGLFESYAGDENTDPKEFARSFHGLMIGLNMTSGVASTAIEALSAGVIKGAGKFVDQMYWSLGLGFLGWQTLAPLLSSGLQPRLERYYKRLYRPERFSASDLRDLYALGEITQERLIDEAKTEGWRDEDIAQWIKLAFRTLGQGDIFDAYHKGLINEAEAVKRLRQLGYDPDDIPLLFELNPAADDKDARDVSAATAKSAYKNHLITADELRDLLMQLRYQDREIELVIALADAQNQSEARQLTLSQVREAWGSNILSDAEVRHWLQEAGYDDATVDVLLKTWTAEAAPIFLRLNKGTVLGAYIEGILDRAKTREKLVSIGLREEDADLEMDLVEARNPENFGRAANVKKRVLTPGTLADLVAGGLIVPDEMRERLIALGYEPADADLLTRAAADRLITEPLPLSQNLIERAYTTGVLTRQGALDRLVAIDYPEENANLILDTVERENPEAFNPELVVTLRVPSISALVQAVQNQIITEQEFYDRTAELGFRPQDAALYLAIAQTGDRKSTKYLSAGQIANAYGVGIFPHALARQRLIALGYSDYDAGVLLRLEKPAVTEDDVWFAMLAAQVEPYTAIQTLAANHYAIEDIRTALHELRPDTIAGMGVTLSDLDSYLNELAQYAAPQV